MRVLQDLDRVLEEADRRRVGVCGVAGEGRGVPANRGGGFRGVGEIGGARRHGFERGEGGVRDAGTRAGEEVVEKSLRGLAVVRGGVGGRVPDDRGASEFLLPGDGVDVWKAHRAVDVRANGVVVLAGVGAGIFFRVRVVGSAGARVVGRGRGDAGGAIFGGGERSVGGAGLLAGADGVLVELDGRGVDWCVLGGGGDGAGSALRGVVERAAGDVVRAIPFVELGGAGFFVVSVGRAAVGDGVLSDLPWQQETGGLVVPMAVVPADVHVGICEAVEPRSDVEEFDGARLPLLYSAAADAAGVVFPAGAGVVPSLVDGGSFLGGVGASVFDFRAQAVAAFRGGRDDRAAGIDFVDGELCVLQFAGAGVVPVPVRRPGARLEMAARSGEGGGRSDRFGDCAAGVGGVDFVGGRESDVGRVYPFGAVAAGAGAKSGGAAGDCESVWVVRGDDNGADRDRDTGVERRADLEGLRVAV